MKIDAMLWPLLSCDIGHLGLVTDAGQLIGKNWLVIDMMTININRIFY